MAFDLLIDHKKWGERIALLEDKKLLELHKVENLQDFSVGNIFVGEVKRLNTSLNAAFVNVGYEKDAFLHYHDIGPRLKSLLKFGFSGFEGGIENGNLNNFTIEPETIKTGSVKEVFKKNQKLLVQVTKEPISSKGPRLTAEISLAGKYFILIPFQDYVNISRKVMDPEERSRLKTLVNSLLPKNFGVICRTASEGKSAKELHQDIQNLFDRWDTIAAKLKNAEVGECIYKEENRSASLLRDLLTFDFEQVVVNDKNAYNNLKDYAKNYLKKDLKGKLKYYNGKSPMFTAYGVEKQINEAFAEKVYFNKKSYLIIEHTEAMHVIDVNSGQVQTANSQEESAFAVNLEAAKEIARQLRLRDLGGLIIIDFIDLKSAENKKKLLQEMNNFMEEDRSKHTILPLSRFSLMQITRERVRPAIEVENKENVENGQNSILEGSEFFQELIIKINELIDQLNNRRLTICMNPFTMAYYKKKIRRLRLKKIFSQGKHLIFKPEASLNLDAVKFLNEDNELIEI